MKRQCPAHWTPRTHLTAAALLAVSTFVSAAPLPTVEVTTCGQIVPRKTIGYLTADLDCTGFDDVEWPGSVKLARHARLELRGFTITGGRYGVLCLEERIDRFGDPYARHVACTVDGGGGRVVDSATHGISFGALVLSNLTVENAGQEGVAIFGKGKRLTNVIVIGSGLDGVHGYAGGVTMFDSTISGSGRHGLVGRTLKVRSSSVTGSGAVPAQCDPPIGCVDVLTVKPPRFQDVTCGTSLEPFEGPWGVCTND